MQERIARVLGLHHTSSGDSLSSITSFARSVNTKKAYKRFCKNLLHIGVTPDIISQKEEEILNIFKPQDSANERNDSGNTADQSQLLEVRYFRWSIHRKRFTEMK